MKIDYITFTVFGMPDEHIKSFWDEFTDGRLGDVIPGKWGGRGFGMISFAMAGAKVYTQPLVKSKKGNYFSIELPGKACACLLPTDYQKLYYLMRGGVDIRITRIDYAYDNLNFTPDQFYNACVDGKINSRSSRKSISRINSPFQLQEDNITVGCTTAYLGSSTSERRVRVYDMHGYTRLEFQLRGEWANTLAWVLLGSDYSTWRGVSLTHLQSFVRVLADWWVEFTNDIQASDIRVYSARVVSVEKISRWLHRQVMPALFAYQAVIGLDELLRQMTEVIKHKPDRLDKYLPIMQMA